MITNIIMANQWLMVIASLASLTMVSNNHYYPDTILTIMNHHQPLTSIITMTMIKPHQPIIIPIIHNYFHGKDDYQPLQEHEILTYHYSHHY